MNELELTARIESVRWRRRYWSGRLEMAVAADDPEQVRVAEENLSILNEQLIRLTNPSRVRVVTRTRP